MKKSIPFYLVLSISFLFAISTNAQIVYKNLSPDVELQQIDTLWLDLDLDSIKETSMNYYFNYDQYYSYRVNDISGPDNFEVVESDLNYDEGLVKAFSWGDSIYSDFQWGAYKHLTFHNWETKTDSNRVGKYLSHCLFDPCGDFVDIDLGYVGFRFLEGSNYFYGWIKIKVLEGDGNLLVDEFAINTTPNEPIQAGAGRPVEANNIRAAIVSNNFNASDIQFHFTPSYISDRFSEYRIMIAKEDDEQAYDLDFMLQVAEENYLTIDATENYLIDYLEGILPESQMDIQGDSIEALTNYRLHILNMDYNGVHEDCVLSEPSDVFSLRTLIQPVINVALINKGVENNSSSLTVVFDDTNSVNGIEKYRVFISDHSDDNIPLLGDLLQLSEDFYTESFYVGSGENQINLNANQKDIQGSIIVAGKFYDASVLTIADSLYDKEAQLSEKSRKSEIHYAQNIYAGQKEEGVIAWNTCDENFADYPFWGSAVYMDSYTHELDLNNDGLPDVSAETSIAAVVHGPDIDVSIRGLRNNKVLVSDFLYEPKWVDILNKNETIGENYSFEKSESIVIEAEEIFDNPIIKSGHFDKWISEVPEYFVAFQLNDYDPPQYAWLKFNRYYYAEYGYSIPVEEYNCFPDGLIFSHQDEIDEFKGKYPLCSRIIGDVVIEGDSIYNLDSLSILENVKNIKIVNCPDLVDISGIININPDSLESLVVKGNEKLSSCKNNFICTLISDYPAKISFMDNDAACSSNEEVLSNCQSSVNNENIYGLKIFPIPADDRINIEFSGSFKNGVLFEIINPMGQVLDSFYMNESKLVKDISNLSKGIYLIRYSQENQTTGSRVFIVE